jgi:recombination protein RecA
VVFINQIREKVGVIYGSPETTTGGRALKFYATIRLEVRKGESIKQGVDIVGSRTKVKVVKNKMAPPFKQAEFDIMYGFGISKEGSVLDIAADLNIVNKSGAWYSYKEERLGQGRENVKEYLREHADVTKEIEEKVLAAHNLIEKNEAESAPPEPTEKSTPAKGSGKAAE